MELLNCGGDSPASRCLNKVFTNAKLGNPEGAFTSSFLYFEDLLPRSVGLAAEESENEKQSANSKNRYLRYGLLFNARLARLFGHFSKANYFIVEAIHLSQRSNDFLSLRLAIMERCALEICSTRHAMLGRFMRNESYVPLSENDGEADPSKNDTIQFNNGLTTAVNAEDAVVSINQQNLSEEAKSENEDSSRNYLSQQIAICEKYLRAVSLAIRCQSPESVTALLRCCAGFDMGVDRAAHSKIVREAARAATCTIQVANCFLRPAEVANYLADEISDSATSDAPAYSGKPLNTEARAILFVNTAYSYALDGKFEKALQFIEMARKRFKDEDNPLAAHHWMPAEACIQFDYDFFNSRIPNFETLSCFSPTEADFRQALLAANNNDSLKALKILKNRLDILQTGTDVVLIIRCLLALGTTYCESRAFRVGIKLLHDALSMAESCNQRLLVAMTHRRIAFVHINASAKGDILEIEKHLAKCNPELEKSDAPRLERGMYYVTMFKFLILQRDRSGIDNMSDVIKYLDRARELFAGHFPQLEKNVYEEAYSLGEALKDERTCRLCKTAYNGLLEHLPEYLNWSLL